MAWPSWPTVYQARSKRVAASTMMAFTMLACGADGVTSPMRGSCPKPLPRLLSCGRVTRLRTNARGVRLDLVQLADAAAAAYVTSMSTQAAAATDAAGRAWLERLRSFIASRSHSQSVTELNERELSSVILEALRQNPGDVEELTRLLGAHEKNSIEGAGTVHGNVTLKGKYVAGRDIRFDR